MRYLDRMGYAFLSTMARVLPLGASYLIGETLALAFFLLSSGRRRNLRSNLEVVLSDRRPSITSTALRVMLNLGRNAVDTFLLPHLSHHQLSSMVSVADRARLDSAVASGRGIILVTAHLGSWELAGAALAAMGYRITTVAGTQFTPGLSPLVKAAKERLGIVVVSMVGGGLKLLRALRQGQVVALHVDGDQYLEGTEVSLFGRRTVMPRGPAALALRSGAIILPAFAIRTSHRRVTVLVEEEISTEDGNQSDLTQRIASIVETYIRRYPDQWCMFRPFWEGRT